MNIIYNILPKDMAYIIDDFAKNRTNYDIKHFEKVIRKTCENRYCIWWYDQSFPKSILNYIDHNDAKTLF